MLEKYEKSTFIWRPDKGSSPDKVSGYPSLAGTQPYNNVSISMRRHTSHRRCFDVMSQLGFVAWSLILPGRWFFSLIPAPLAPLKMLSNPSIVRNMARVRS